ncbi:MAG: hypothetical protein ACI9H6_000625 [Patiriisocius sp.]|jgi:hypothetical protein
MKYFFLVFLLLPVMAYAQLGTGGSGNDGLGSGSGSADGIGSGPSSFSGSVELRDPLSNISTIPEFFQAIIDILIIFAIPFVVFFIIYAGFLYVTARGNSETIKRAHNALLYALIGGLLILGANVLLTVITGTVGQITS